MLLLYKLGLAKTLEHWVPSNPSSFTVAMTKLPKLQLEAFENHKYGWLDAMHSMQFSLLRISTNINSAQNPGRLLFSCIVYNL